MANIDFKGKYVRIKGTSKVALVVGQGATFQNKVCKDVLTLRKSAKVPRYVNVSEVELLNSNTLGISKKYHQSYDIDWNDRNELNHALATVSLRFDVLTKQLKAAKLQLKTLVSLKAEIKAAKSSYEDKNTSKTGNR